MDFTGYTAYDFIGTVVGLNQLIKVVHAMIKGDIVAPILGLLVFFTFVKIALEGIVNHKYDRALKDFSFMLITILLFIVGGSATVYNMDITNFGIVKQEEQAASSTSSSSSSASDTTQTTVSGVPLMAYFFSIPDQVAYELTNIMLAATGNQNVSLDQQSIIQDPRSLTFIALLQMIHDLPPNAQIQEYNTAQYCIIGQKKSGVGNRLLAFMTGGYPPDCKSFYNQWATTLDFEKNVIAKNLNLPQGTQDAITAQETLLKNIASLDCWGNAFTFDSCVEQAQTQLPTSITSWGVNLSYQLKQLEKATENANSNGCTSSEGILCWISEGTRWLTNKYAEFSSNIMTSRLTNQTIMFQIQEYVVAAMFVLLPFVVVLSLFPIFGYNFKLLGTYMGAFFLIKLWIPLYWLLFSILTDAAPLMYSMAHETMHVMYAIANYGVSLISGQTAYALDPTQVSQAIEIQALVKKTSHFNEAILNSAAMLIPSVLGGSATFIFGKAMVDGIRRSIDESMLFTAELINLAKKIGFNKLASLGNRPKPPAPATSSAPTSTAPQDRIQFKFDRQNLGTKKTEIVYGDFVKSENGFYLPTKNTNTYKNDIVAYSDGRKYRKLESDGYTKRENGLYLKD